MHPAALQGGDGKALMACGIPESTFDFTRISASIITALPTAIPMRQPVML
jgi:hypothetical protein